MKKLFFLWKLMFIFLLSNSQGPSNPCASCFPTQAGHAGQFLMTNGTSKSWRAISGSAWSLMGNTGIDSGQFIGTTDGEILIVKSATAVNIQSNGQLVFTDTSQQNAFLLFDIQNGDYAMGDIQGFGNRTSWSVADYKKQGLVNADSGFLIKNLGGDSLRFWTDDTTRIMSNKPIKIGGGSLIIGTTGNVYADNGIKIGGAVVNVPQYAAPTTGQTVTSNGSSNLIINPLGTLLALTVAFPASPEDGQLFSISSTKILTGLTLTSSATILGTLTTLASANGFAGWVYSSTASSWIRNK